MRVRVPQADFAILITPPSSPNTLRQKYAKIAIIDTDMHHGQGIQEIFYDHSDVLYTSVHASPINFYPAVTGHEFEKGVGAGEGYNINFPMPHGTRRNWVF